MTGGSDGWLEGDLRGKSGNFPGNYTEPLALPRRSATIDQQMSAMVIHVIRAAEVVVTFPEKYGAERWGTYDLATLRDKLKVTKQELVAVATHKFSVR